MTDGSSTADPRGAVGVLAGIRVVEVSHFAYVPSACAVLADWGADVVKIENPATGDPMRGGMIGGIPPGFGGLTFMWELTNRNKRSVGLDLSSEQGRELLMQLVEGADVFVTSFLPGVRAKLRIGESHIRAVNPTIVYAAGTGQGARGDEADQGGFDQTSYWYRSGVASALVEEGEWPPDLPGAGFGDVTSGLVLAGGISAALLHRERTGEGIAVDGSLLATGMWAMGPSLAATGLTGKEEFRFPGRTETTNPLVNAYRTSDGRFIGLCVLRSDAYWVELCEALGHPEIGADERFSDAELRATNGAACVAALDAAFAEGTLAHWVERLSTQGGPWAIVQRSDELRRDPQVEANGYLQTVDYGDGRTIDLVPSPIQFGGAAPTLSPAPEVGADTEEVLLELGLDWDALIELKVQQVIS